MSPSPNRQILLASRPEGEPKPDNFRLVVSEAPEPAESQVLLRTLWLSLEPEGAQTGGTEVITQGNIYGKAFA